MDKFICKVTSRKFLLCLAAFLAAFGMGAAGVISQEACTICMALSAGIYAACEAYVDGQSARANGTSVVVSESTARSVTATSADKATVVAAFRGDAE